METMCRTSSADEHLPKHMYLVADNSSSRSYNLIVRILRGICHTGWLNAVHSSMRWSVLGHSSLGAKEVQSRSWPVSGPVFVCSRVRAKVGS